MKELRKHIHRRKLEFAALPLFAYLRDASIDPRERLSIAPCLAEFTMIFGDPSRYIRRSDPRWEDPFQRIVDAHAVDRDRHWAWFLREYEGLDAQRKPRFADTVRFMWGKGTAQTRSLSSELTAWLRKAGPLYKYVVLTALKAHGSAVFASVLKAACDLRNETGYESIFHGEFNLAPEPGRKGAGAERGLEEAVNRRELSPTERARGVAVADKIHLIFRSYAVDLHRHAVRGSAQAAQGSATTGRSAAPRGVPEAGPGAGPGVVSALDPKRAPLSSSLGRLAG